MRSRHRILESFSRSTNPANPEHSSYDVSAFFKPGTSKRIKREWSKNNKFTKKDQYKFLLEFKKYLLEN